MSNLPSKPFTSTTLPKPSPHLLLRTLQLLTTLTTLPLYATTLTHSSSSPSSYIYALVCCTLTLSTLLIYAIPKIAHQKFFLWDFCIAVLWAALAGVFGIVYFDGRNGRDGAEWVEGQQGKMKVAVWFDLLGMVCWIVTAGWGCVRCVKGRLQARRLRKEERKMENMLEGQEEGFVLQGRDDDIDCEKGLIEEKSEKDMLKGKYEEA